jgi:hypothetical protein
MHPNWEVGPAVAIDVAFDDEVAAAGI